jgi:hypothetical protein
MRPSARVRHHVAWWTSTAIQASRCPPPEAERHASTRAHSRARRGTSSKGHRVYSVDATCTRPVMRPSADVLLVRACDADAQRATDQAFHYLWHSGPFAQSRPPLPRVMLLDANLADRATRHVSSSCSENWIALWGLHTMCQQHCGTISTPE